jgi:CheY-like chemotaxis protein
LTAGPKRLLFVSPSGYDRDFYVSSLRNAGFDVEVRDAIADAADVLAATMPDLIVMDLLPQPDSAWAFIQRLASDVPTIPVILLTAMVRPDRSNRLKARRLGCAAFVAKPCSPARLVDVVLRVERGERGLEIVDYTV